MYTTQKKKRQRIAKACNFCRHRKVKCDGLSPCRNCREAEIQDCVYTDSATKSSKCERNEKNNSLEERLERVEAFIGELSRQFKISLPDTQNAHVNELNNYRYHPFESFSREELKLETGPSGKAMSKFNLINNDETNIQKHGPFKNKSPRTDKLNLKEFPGSQFNFCKLSNTFIRQLKYNLPKNEQELVVPFENMQKTFSESVKCFEQKWIDIPLINPNQLLNGKYLSNSEFVTSLLEKYYEQNILQSYICTLAEMLELFRIHFASQITGYTGRKLSESELLIMNITLGMAILAKVDKLKRSKLIKHLEKIYEEENIVDGLEELQEECFSNSMFYFHRILLLNDGIQTVKALVSLIIYAEFNISNSHIDNVLLSLAIRLAQDIGLQRYDNYRNLPKHQVMMRQRLWLLLEHFDIEMAFRKGKNPIINIIDDELNDKLLTIDNEVMTGWVLNSRHTFNFSYFTFTKQLTRIRIKTYQRIFDASITSFKEISNALDSLNEEMHNLTRLLHPDCRPLFAGVQNFNLKKILSWVTTLNLEDVQSFRSLTCLIGFFSHLIVLNTIPMCVTFTNVEHETNCDGYGIISTNCCRIILNIASNIDRRIIPQTYMNTIIHHITSAFLCLLYKSVNSPWLPDTLENIGLLLNVSHGFFATYTRTDFEQPKDSKLSKEKKLELLCIVALKVGIKIYDIKTSSNVFTSNASFMGHVDSLKQQFPLIFEKKPRREMLFQFSENEIKDNGSGNYNLAPNTKPEIGPLASRTSQPCESSPMIDLHIPSENFMGKGWVPPSILGSNSNLSEEFRFWNEAQYTNGGSTNLHNFFYESDFGI